PAAEVVAVVEEIEAFQSEQDRAARPGEAMLDERADVGGGGAAERRLADDLAVDDGAVVVRAVAVVVDAGGGVERAGGRELADRAGGEVERELVAERDHRAVALVEQARPAFF